MEKEVIMTEIAGSCLNVLLCVQSLEYITKDLEEMETQANWRTEGYYSGLSNIVKQMARKIEEEVEVIMELSEQ